MVLTSPSAPQGLLLLHPPFSAVDSKLLYHPLPFKVNLPHEELLPKTHSAHEKEFLIGGLSFRKLAILAQARDLGHFASLRMVPKNSLMFAPGIWATASEQIFSTIRPQSSFSMKFHNRAASCEKFAYFIENFFLKLASAVSGVS